MVMPDRPGCRVGPSSQHTVREALARHLAGYVATAGPDPHRLRVLRRIVACRTPAMGMHRCVCGSCGWSGCAPNSCRDRHCPQCQGRDAVAWLAARSAAMLPVPHFQVVFTLPGALRPLARANPCLVYGLLFTVASSVLRDLAGQRMQARLGITAVLHTWTADLLYHPHVHCLVTAGGLHHGDDRWVPSRPGFLFPQRVMGEMFRGRMLEALIAARDAGELDLGDGDLAAAEKATARLFRNLARRHARWIVHVEAPRGRPVEHVARYLARYVKRVAIGDRRVVRVEDGHVTFRARGRLIRLPGPEFVRRFGQHVLPRGFRKVRHYGLYAPGNAKRRREQARALVPRASSDRQQGQATDVSSNETDAPTTEDTSSAERCPHCGEPGLQRILLWPAAFRRARGPP